MYSSIWYDNLIKPVFQPPAWIFLPVWIILYGILFIAIILFAITLSKQRKLSGYIYFIVHILFNMLWSPIFFTMHRIDIAFVIILIMDLSAAFLIYKFFSVSKLAGGILFPYMLWLIFATYLNYGFLMLN